MVKKKISRKNFINRSLSALAGISLINKYPDTPLPGPGLRDVGKTGIRVSPVCFGAPRTNEESLIMYAIDKGINFIDTGRSYSNGNNEVLVGRAVAGKREKIVIQSKLRMDPGELSTAGKGQKGAGQIRAHLSARLEASLKALNTDYIDILLYHDAPGEDLLFHQETMKFFSDLKDAGTIRAHGFSAHNDSLDVHRRNNAEKFYDVIMVPFNFKGSFVHSVSGRFSEWDQTSLVPLLEEASEKGIGIISMKTCSGGKYSPSPSTEASFQESVKWVLNKKYISSAAVAMATFEQVNEYLPLL